MVWCMSHEQSLSPTTLGISSHRRMMVFGLDVAAGPAGDVVDDQRQVGRRGDGGEVVEEARLGGLVVVGAHLQRGVGAQLGGQRG